MLAELTRFHGETRYQDAEDRAVVWRRICPMFILLIFWAVAARIFDTFVKRVADLSLEKLVPHSTRLLTHFLSILIRLA